MAKKVESFIWRPGKDLAEGVVEVVAEPLEDIGDWESDFGEWESDDEDCNMLPNTVSPEMKTTSQYEKEDWDKELAEYEHNNNPYELEDVIHCGSFLDQDPAEFCVIHCKPLYDPSLDHAAPLTLSQLETMPVDGQFDDAAD
ncbi:Coordinator of PRMT5 and differentiation stimulator, partial [Varanus komodoensis]